MALDGIVQISGRVENGDQLRIDVVVWMRDHTRNDEQWRAALEQ